MKYLKTLGAQGFIWRLILLVAFVAMGLNGCASVAVSDAASEQEKLTDPQGPRARAKNHLNLAEAYFVDGKPGIALESVKQAIATDPSWFESYNMQGLIYGGLNDAKSAEESFRRALILNPDAATVQHNYGWLLCKESSRFADAMRLFSSALTHPTYREKAKTWMTQGQCQLERGLKSEAEVSFLRAYELDASNPFVGYNLALLLFQRGEYVRSQFYIRRINNGDLANAESLWLGIKVERRLDNRAVAAQLGSLLGKRFPQSKENSLFERGAFDE